MINLDDVTKENIKRHSTNHPYRILITRCSRSGKQIHYLIS